MKFAYDYGDYFVTEVWHDKPRPVVGLHCVVSNDAGDEVVVLPPGAEADWPCMDAAKRWFSRSLDSLIAFGFSEADAERLLMKVYSRNQKSPD